MSAKILDISEAEYHADPCETPSLSASIAKVLIAQSPLHAWQRHPRLGGVREKPTKAMDHGSLIHAIILGAGAEKIEIIDAADFRTKAAQSARDSARVAGKVPVLAHEFAEIETAAIELGKRIADLGIEFKGRSEVKVTWTETLGAGEPVLCRGMIDHLMGPRICDLKKTQAGDLESVRRAIVNYGYDIQGAAYSSALAKLHPELLGRVDFVLVFIEIEPPYAVTPVRFDNALRQLGELRWERAVLSWGQCLRTGKWPSYVDQIVSIDAPPWALSNYQF